MERRQESLQQEYYSELQESKFCPVRTLKNYTQTVQQAVLRAKECVLKTAATIQENAEDVYAEAQQINEDRAAKEEQEYAEAVAAEEAEEQRKQQKLMRQILLKRQQSKNADKTAKSDR